MLSRHFLAHGYGMTAAPETEDFGEWIERLRVQRQATKKDLAEATGLHPSTFSREVKAGSLGWKPLLRLALVIGQSPSVVLRRAGKTEEADLIERCYGPPLVIARPDVRAVAELLEGQERDVAQTLRDVLDLVLRVQSRAVGASTPLATEPATHGRRRSRGIPRRKRRDDAGTTP